VYFLKYFVHFSHFEVGTVFIMFRCVEVFIKFGNKSDIYTVFLLNMKKHYKKEVSGC